MGVSDCVLEITSLDSGLGMIIADFFRREIVLARDYRRVLLRAGCFFPGGTAIAAVVVSESGCRLGTRVDAGAYASTYGTSMAHAYCLTAGVAVSGGVGPSA